MDWDQIAESLKQLRGKIVSVRNAATGRRANRDLSMGRTASYDHEQDEATSRNTDRAARL
jgi:hypothetical protein